MLVEGKSFEHNDIDSVESRATKGKVVESKEKATALWHSFVAFPVVALLLGMPFMFGTYVGSEMGVSAMQYLEEKLDVFGQSKQLAGYKQTITEKYTSIAGALAGAANDGRIGIELQEIVRRGDILTVSLKLSNNTGQILAASANIQGISGRGPLYYDDSRSDTFPLAPKESKSLKLRVFVPEDGSVQLIEGSYSFKVPGSDELTVDQLITFNPRSET